MTSAVTATLDPTIAQALAELFRALADPTRLRLIAPLLAAGAATAGALARQGGLSESAVSHQLRGLRQMRLVRTRRAGRHVWYALDDDHVAALYRMGLDHVRHG